MTRRIVLGVTGGIAAYKAVEVCRRLVDEGAHVVPVLTEEATRFIGEVTFSALASEPVRKSLFDDADPIPHTHLGQEADLIVVAPATARFIGSYAAGISDGLLLATVLATRAPVLVCPAMHTEMWEHPAAQENLATLRRRGVHIVPPATGRLAGGDQGEGRLADIDDIVSAALGLLSGDMVGISVLVSAGGTREPIDPVRVITNRSSGKQGHAIAAAAAARGGSVILVTTADQPVYPGIEVVRVDTAAEMEEVMTARALESDVVIMVAAVADFRPKEISEQKLSKADGPPELILEPRRRSHGGRTTFRLLWSGSTMRRIRSRSSSPEMAHRTGRGRRQVDGGPCRARYCQPDPCREQGQDHVFEAPDPRRHE
jgi:phosphopantothenoylcysteine decarboxylase/phosphopantothenate--cysteine ligase